MNDTLEDLVIWHTHRVPEPSGAPGDGAAAARQCDAVLASVGWKLSGDLLKHLSGLEEGAVIDTAVRVLGTVRAMVGDHVRHNVYFRDFPKNVPSTEEFWMECLRKALLDPVAAEGVAAGAEHGVLNLLALPTYGRYQHSYEEMLAGHDELIAIAGDRVTVLHLGDTLEREVEGLYLGLAGAVTPLNGGDLEALRFLAEWCVAGAQPETIPVRENRAVINQVRLGADAGVLVDTTTDVLRLACALSDGDVTLQEPTRFTSFRRPVRRALLAGLDGVVRAAPGKLGDVAAYREQWKRLGERLHPHEYPQWEHAAQVFAVARGEQSAPSFAGRVERLLAGGDVPGAARLLEGAPGLLLRSADRLLRTASTRDAGESVLASLERVAGKASGRVLLSLREHLQNRPDKPGQARVFVNRISRGQVVPDERPRLDADLVTRLTGLLDAEVLRRLPAVGHLVVDPDVLEVALPLTGKGTAGGFGVLPRGSVSRIDGKLLRFFIYWKEAADTTDFDLSALLLNGDFRKPTWLSYTALTRDGAQHSGDITSAPNGASEFINLELGVVRARVIIPQVNVFSGEGFDEVEESFFGFMLRDAEQAGAPFEARTVRMKSELRGSGRIALPLAFLCGDDGQWRAKWLHVFLRGGVSFNQVENNRVATTTLVRAIVERKALNLRYLTELWSAKAEQMTVWDGKTLPAGPVTFVGLEQPDGLPDEAEFFGLQNLRDLISE